MTRPRGVRDEEAVVRRIERLGHALDPKAHAAAGAAALTPVNDYGLRADFAERYERHGRWVFVAALFGGFALGATTDVSERTLALLLAFLAGGVVLNVLKEELPEERESRFSAFVLGAAGYAALLLAV